MCSFSFIYVPEILGVLPLQPAKQMAERSEAVSNRFLIILSFAGFESCFRADKQSVLSFKKQK